MEAFAPDFSQYWLDAPSSDSSTQPVRVADDEPLSASQKEALDALVDRINAARSVV